MSVNYSVRLSSVVISNFKNIEYGELSFLNPSGKYEASLLGLYGQNGSGKTALIDSLEILKYVLTGKAVPGKYKDYITAGEDYSTFSFTFILKNEDKTEEVSYSFSLGLLDTQEMEGNTGAASSNTVIRIFNEVIKAELYGEKANKKGRIIDTSTSDVIAPRPKKTLFFRNADEVNLKVLKRYALLHSTSFLFSGEIIKMLRDNEKGNSDEYCHYVSLISSLALYANESLFIINTRNNAMIALDTQPLLFRLPGEVSSVLIPLSGPSAIRSDQYELISKIISNLNIVLKVIIPGLSISLENLGPMYLSDGTEGRNVQLMSLRDGRKIPLSSESEGIKKIVSILNLLIAVWNRNDVTVAIDELDNGIFEYLLGELLRMIAENGCGQLVFTSHNLRPLETIDKGFIAFTTTDPKNRFMRIRNVKETNNLRDLYYRNIMFNDRYDNLYNETKNYEITLAFFEAGGSSAE